MRIVSSPDFLGQFLGIPAMWNTESFCKSVMKVCGARSNRDECDINLALSVLLFILWFHAKA